MIGKTFSHYEIEELLGRGGMGEVFRARDTKLGREVALKFLPLDLATNPERLARFKREAKVLASLNHPNIAAIYGLEESEGKNFLVMELAEGEDLSQRISKGRLPVEDALDIARQIAEGLEEAHEKGIVHRDLKPANVKLASDGKVKVLDFGLARAYVGEAGDEENLENSPTITAAMTQKGVILGTAAYMSPEQAKGKSVDRRADLWSFGVILWEMLTGQRLFEGETVSDTLAAVLRDHPPYDDLPEETPAVVRRLLERCLERDPRKRLRDIGEARVRLERWKEDPSALFETQASLLMEAPRSRVRSVLPWAVAALAVLVAALAWFWPAGKGDEALPSLQLAIQLDQQDKLQANVATNVFLSPSGNELAYLAGGQIHLRRLDKLQSRTLDGTHSASIACYSPDGAWIGFTSDGKLERVSVTGGTPVEICDAVDSRGVCWPNESTLVFSPNFSSGLSMVSLSDGIPQSLTTLDTTRAERSHRWPHAMPDGRSVLFMCQFFGRNYDESDIVLVDLETKKRRTIYHGGASPRYVEDGYLVFARKNTVFAIPFDLETGTTRGLATPVLDNVWTSIGDQETDDGSTQFDFAPNGTLVYQTSARFDQRSQLAWLDLETGDLQRIGTLANLMAPMVSPDQKSVAVMRGDDASREIYIVDLASGVENRLTFDSGGDIAGCWSPDSKFYYYSRPAKNGEYVMYRKPADGSGDEVELFRRRSTILADSVSPDGRWMCSTFWAGADQWDEYIIDLSNPDAEPTLIAGGPDQQYSGLFSPDGKWLAYGQNRGDEWQLYLRHFPVTAGRWEILQSKSQIQSADWGGQGDAFYARNGRGFLRIPLLYSGGGVRAGIPQLLQNDSSTFVHSINWRTSVVTPDGKRAIVMARPASVDSEDVEARSKIVLVTNWFKELESKVKKDE